MIAYYEYKHAGLSEVLFTTMKLHLESSISSFHWFWPFGKPLFYVTVLKGYM